MKSRFSREDVVARLQSERDNGRAVYDALCGSGITAKFAARGGADLICTHSLAHFRMQGLSSMAGYLPIGDANAITLEIGERAVIKAVGGQAPVIAGLLCVDPTRDQERLLDLVQDAGFDGVMNCPTVALIDGGFRQALEETGMGYDLEVEMLGRAHQRGLFTKAFCTTPDEALAMAEAGVDNIIIHFGNSSGGSIGSKSVLAFDQAVERSAVVCDALASQYADRTVTVHGGPFEVPEEVGKLLESEPRLHGYVGGSSAERFPIEESVPAATAGFKALKTRG